MKTLPITGSFFEFEHPNRAERVLTHEIQCAFSEAQWRQKVRETADIGIDTLVLLATAHRGVAYFPFEDYPYPAYLRCPQVLEVFLDEADKTGQAVYLGVGFYGDTMDSVANSTDPVTVATALRAMNALLTRYGHHPCIVGWYLADEWCIWEHFDERFITYINTVAAEARRLNPRHKVILAPFGTHCLKADDVFVSQLARIDADVIAYQDEVGVRKLTVDRVAARFGVLQAAHEKAGRAKLWADMEVFGFEGTVYQSALLPAPWERVKAQMEAISPFVEKIIIYTYQGMMTKPGGIARCGDETAEKLYTDYKNWLDSVK